MFTILNTWMALNTVLFMGLIGTFIGCVMTAVYEWAVETLYDEGALAHIEGTDDYVWVNVSKK